MEPDVRLRRRDVVIGLELVAIILLVILFWVHIAQDRPCDVRSQPAQVAHWQPVIVNPGVPASVFWPAHDENPIPGAVFHYRLTDDYWSRFRACRLTATFDACRDTVIAQYEVVRVR